MPLQKTLFTATRKSW